MKFSELVGPTRGRLLGEECQFETLGTDTRTLQKGDVFVALKGPNFNGHEFASVAAEKGAVGLVVEQEIPDISLPQLIVADTTKALGVIANEKRKMFSGKVVAVTGSCGKTTVKEMLASICRESAATLATRGNLNNFIGVPLTLMRLDNQYRYAVIEAGTSGRGEIGYLTDIIQPDVALVNNVFPVHVEGIGGVDEIAREKSSIYGGAQQGIAVIGFESKYAGLFDKAAGAKEKIYFGRRQQLASRNGAARYVLANDVQTDPQTKTTRFELQVEENSVSVNLLVPGEHSILNALAAAACAVALNIDLGTIRAGLESFSGVAGRMQVKAGLCGCKIIDDTYNASPGAVRAAIDYLKQYPETVLVLGDMGELGSTASAEHAGVGEYARRAGIASLYVTGKHAADVATGYGGGFECPSQEDLIEKLKGRLTERSVVLVKGSRSTRMENVVAALVDNGER